MGILPEVDARAVRAHAAICSPCREELEEMSRVSSLLPLAVEDFVPSESVKSELMARIGSEPRGLAAARETRPARRWFAAAAAAVALFAGLAGLGGYLAGDSGSGNGSTSANEARADALAQSAAQGTLQVAKLAQGSLQATLVRAPGAADGFVWVEGMPELPAGKTFKAWFIKEGAAPQPSTAFSDRSGGVWLAAGSPIESFGSVAFTIEQDGDAAKPSSTPFAIIPLKSSAAIPAATDGAS
jgi:hypothetical protein